MSKPTNVARILLPILALFCLTPWMNAGLAIAAGALVALTIGNPYVDRTKKWTHPLLSSSVIGLGAGMNLITVGHVGAQGIGYTAIGITCTFALGWLLSRILKVEDETATLITVGTAICGGSAIAAVAPVIRAKPQTVSVALGTVFLLNASALFLFPVIGHALHMEQTPFGLWSALAIHDTSSVVGSAMQFGPQALEVGTTVKLARALWIVPVTLVIGFIVRRKDDGAGPKEKPRRPWFILGFVLMAALVTWVPVLQPAGHVVDLIARRFLVLTLFLIGANLTRSTVKSVGPRPFALGFVLWILVGSATLAAITAGWIR